jgi:hypothetical protein
MQSIQNPLTFLYWVFFKPISLRRFINEVDPAMGNMASMAARPCNPSAHSIRSYVLLYTLLIPCLLGFGLGGILSCLGMDVNWLKLALYLLIGIGMSSTFSIGFGIAFLLPFSLAAAMASSTALNLTTGIIFSLTLGLAYGLLPNRAAWGVIASLVYGLVSAAAFGAWNGGMIGLAFFLGYFRIPLFMFEAPFAWILSHLADRGDALRLWRFNPIVWDEVIWFPLPGLGRHLLALKRQNESASQDAIALVQASFRHDGITEYVPKKG